MWTETDASSVLPSVSFPNGLKEVSSVDQGVQTVNISVQASQSFHGCEHTIPRHSDSSESRSQTSGHGEGYRPEICGLMQRPSAAFKYFSAYSEASFVSPDVKPTATILNR